jgi:hypothetical protein
VSDQVCDVTRQCVTSVICNHHQCMKGYDHRCHIGEQKPKHKTLKNVGTAPVWSVVRGRQEQGEDSMI